MEKEITFREYTRLFIEFLKKHKVLKRYKQEIIKQRASNINSFYEYVNPLLIYPLINHIRSGDIQDVIDYAFTWDKTNEGQGFWDDLDSEWIGIMKEKIIIPEKIYNSK